MSFSGRDFSADSLFCICIWIKNCFLTLKLEDDRKIFDMKQFEHGILVDNSDKPLYWGDSLNLDLDFETEISIEHGSNFEPERTLDTGKPF